MSDELEAAVEAYRHDQKAAPPLTAFAEAALRQYLAERGYLASGRSLRITPAESGSSIQDTSINHDRRFAET